MRPLLPAAAPHPGLSGSALAAGCGSSSNGELGVASFTVKNCGGSFSDIAGCDIKQFIATGGKIDMRAVPERQRPLQAAQRFPTVISVTDLGGASYTLNALRPGEAIIIASMGSTDVDRGPCRWDDAAQIRFSFQPRVARSPLSPPATSTASSFCKVGHLALDLAFRSDRRRWQQDARARDLRHHVSARLGLTQSGKENPTAPSLTWCGRRSRGTTPCSSSTPSVRRATRCRSRPLKRFSKGDVCRRSPACVAGPLEPRRSGSAARF